MEDFLFGLLVGVVGCTVGSRGNDYGSNLYARMTEWRNCRRFDRFKAKASAAGFGNLFTEEWDRLGMDHPRNQNGMECEMAFQRARRRFDTSR